MSEIADNADGKIGCRICSARVHAIGTHLTDHHPEVSLADYKARFPGAPVLSDAALAMIEKRKKAEAGLIAEAVEAHAHPAETEMGAEAPMYEVFDLGKVKTAMRGDGSSIMVKTITAPAELRPFVPDVDKNYVFPIDLLKIGLMGLHVNKPTYFWGMMGTGKSTIFEQIAARMGWPMMRIQHTRNTEEHHVIGQYVVRDGSTVFELGPLAYAMKHGLIYLADEYDFGMPAVLALYQPVLEGKALIIKDAPMELRVIRPHPNFRFVATGNTNGTGDETGLYQGTLLQNAANYERFGIVKEVGYMPKAIETQIVAAQASIPKEFAEKLVDFAHLAREAYKAQKIGLPPSPRAIINSAQSGVLLGDWKAGIELSYLNRLSRSDKEAAMEVLRRVTF